MVEECIFYFYGCVCLKANYIYTGGLTPVGFGKIVVKSHFPTRASAFVCSIPHSRSCSVAFVESECTPYCWLGSGRETPCYCCCRHYPSYLFCFIRLHTSSIASRSAQENTYRATVKCKQACRIYIPGDTARAPRVGSSCPTGIYHAHRLGITRVPPVESPVSTEDLLIELLFSTHCPRFTAGGVAESEARRALDLESRRRADRTLTFSAHQDRVRRLFVS